MKYLKIYEEFTRSCNPDSNLKQQEEVTPHTAETTQEEHDKKKEEKEEHDKKEQESIEALASSTTVSRNFTNS